MTTPSIPTRRHGASRSNRPHASLFICFALLTALSAPWSGAKVGPVTIFDALATLTVAIGVVKLTQIRERLFIPAWALFPSLAALLVLAFNVIVHGTALMATSGAVPPSVAFGRVVVSTFGIALVGGLASVLAREKLRSIVGFFVAGSATSAGYALLQSLGVRPTLPGVEQVVSEFTGRWSGLASHPNALAQASVLAMPATFFLWRSSGKLGRWALVISITLLTLSVFASGSRAGLLIGAVLLPVCAIATVAPKAGLNGVLVAAAGALALAVVFGPGLLSQTRLGQGDEYGAALSNSGRIEAISAGWDAFSASPLVGSGLGVWYGEFGVLVLLAGGGLLLATSYLVFLAGTAMSVRRLTLSFRIFPLLSIASVLMFSVLNNGIFERYTFFFAIVCAMYSISNYGNPADLADG